jgi:anti-sigma B factor antagonist
MLLTTEELPAGITLVHLNGRMDIAGSMAIDTELNAIAGSKRAIVINLSQVSFLASMGMRTLVMSAKTIASRGGRFACFGADENVTRVLTTSGIADVLPLVPDLAAATAAVR